VDAVGDNLKYQWFLNGEPISGATSSSYEAVLTAEKEGLYYVEILGDCNHEISDEVRVSSCFEVLIKWDDVLFVQNIDNRYMKFQWYQDGYAIPVNGNSIYYTNPKGLTSSYYVRAYYEDGTYDQSCSLNFGTKDNGLAIQVKWEDVLYIVNENKNYVKYQWYKNNEPVWTDGNSAYYTHTEGLLGTYYVKAYYAEGTYDESNRLVFDALTRSSSISVYPNPVISNHYLNVESNEAGESYIGGRLSLYDLSGRLLYTGGIVTAQIQLPMNYPAGNYVLSVTHPSGRVTTQKVVIK